tara:strand:- start:354 stop:1265 length:912 start_codon:yes stop_codon:yes gene_type:complete
LNNKKVVLISFYTEGKPHDKGINLSDAKNIFLKKNLKLFDRVILYSPRELIKKNKKWEAILFSENFYNFHKKTRQRKNSINYEWIKLNSLLWKPAIIIETLNNSEIPENSIIIYHDINLIKYPFYLDNFKILEEKFSKKLKKRSIALCNDSFFKLSNDCKQELIRSHLGSNGNTLLHKWAGCIGIRKNKIAYEFCKYWFDLTIIDKNRSQLTKFDKYPEFAWHSQEQATLSVAFYKWKYNISRSKDITSFFTINYREILLKWNFKNKIIYIKRFCFFIFKNNIFKFFLERLILVFFSNFRKFN